MKEIVTDRYILKLLNDEYLNDVYEVLSNPKVIENLNMSIHKDIDDTKKLFNSYYEGYRNK